MSARNCYNLLTDSGLWNGTGTRPAEVTVSKAIWNAAVDACVLNDGTYRFIQPLYIPGGVRYNFSEKQCELKTNLKVFGDGNTSVLAFNSSFNGGRTTEGNVAFSECVLTAFGHSHYQLKDLAFSGNAKQINAFIQLSSYGANNTTICRGVTLENLDFSNLWGTGICFGNTSAGASHRFETVYINNIKGYGLGNPANPYVIGEAGAGNDYRYCHLLNLNADCDSLNISNVWGYNLSGHPVRYFGNSQASSLTTVRTSSGAQNISKVFGMNTNFCVEVFGNYQRPGIIVSDCMSINHTGTFAYSLEGANMTGTNLNAFSWNGHSLYELRAINGRFSGIGVSYTNARTAVDKTNDLPGFAPDPTVKQTSASNLILTAGFNVDLSDMHVYYDQQQGVSSLAPNRRCGVHMVGQSDSSTQATTWDGINNYFGFKMPGFMANTTGPFVYAEIFPIADVGFSGATYKTPYLSSSEFAIQIYAPADTTGLPGWNMDGLTLNTKGSPTPANTRALVGFGGLQTSRTNSTLKGMKRITTGNNAATQVQPNLFANTSGVIIVQNSSI